MGRGSQRLVSAWIPLPDTPLELGGVCIAAGSSTLPGFAAFRRTYMQHDVQRSAVRGATGSSGIFTNDPQELLARDPSLRFLTADYKAGDVLLFKAMGTVHGAVRNNTNETRLSMDVRWQPLAEPWDDRYITGGDRLEGVPFGTGGDTELIDYAALSGSARHPDGPDGTLTFDEQKREWGLRP